MSAAASTLGSIGGGVIVTREARPGEVVLWARFANRTQGGYRAVGGKLFLTNQRLLFLPNRVDAALGGHAWEAELADVRGVGRQPARRRPTMLFSGGLRDRLRVVLNQGPVELFVVNQLEEVIARLEQIAA